MHKSRACLSLKSSVSVFLAILVAASSIAAVAEKKASLQKIQPFVVTDSSMKKLMKKPVRLPAKLSRSQHAELSHVIQQVKQRNIGRAKQHWEKLISQIVKGGTKADIDALMQFVLRESYLETNRALQHYANKVKNLNKVKQSIANEIVRTHKLQTGNNIKKRKRELAIYEVQTIEMNRTQSREGTSVKLKQKNKTMNSRQLDTYIEQLEQDLATVGDDAQLANIDLQNHLQKTQQTLQLISNVSKMLHDTARAIIRKLG